MAGSRALYDPAPLPCEARDCFSLGPKVKGGTLLGLCSSAWVAVLTSHDSLSGEVRIVSRYPGANRKEIENVYPTFCCLVFEVKAKSCNC